MCRFTEILFGSSRNLVDLVQVIEPTDTRFIGPVKPDQLDTRRDHLISMAVQGGVDQHIASSCLYAPVVSGFLEAACQYNGRIGVKMPMPRQAKAARQRLQTWRDAPKTRVVDRHRHLND
jgi:hypothetical protein